MSDKFSLVKRGYDTNEVDQYIATLEQVLASYKEKDNAIKNALISAQMAADAIVKNAELESDKIKSKACSMLVDISQSMHSQKQFVQNFQDDYQLLIDKYVTPFNGKEVSKVYADIMALEDYLSKILDENKTTTE